MSTAPILHFSLPVADLEASVAYYETILGCTRGRSTERFVDLWFFGAQLTLVRRDSAEAAATNRGPSPHFGAIVSPDVLDETWTRVQSDARADVISPLTSSGTGTDRQQTKMMFSDPDGHAIELKSYANLQGALGVFPARSQQAAPATLQHRRPHP